MTIAKHKTTEDLVTQVTRSFDIAVSQHHALDKDIDKIVSAAGVIRADATSDRAKLQVSYDVRETDAKEIQCSIEAAGLSAPSSLWRQARVTWLGYLDTNCRDNAAHRPACCSNPPPGAGARRGHHH